MDQNNRMPSLPDLPDNTSAPVQAHRGGGAPDNGRAPAMPQRGLTAEQAQERRLTRKRWLLLGALVFFLFSIIFIVPARFVPGFGALGRWMGVTMEGSYLSLAGLVWARATGADGAAQANAALSIFDSSRQGTALSAAETGLFDLSAINAFRRSRGLRPDGLSGLASGNNSEDDLDAVFNRPINGWSKEAQAAIAQQQAQTGVYFGQDASLLARLGNARTAGSSDTVNLLPSANIINAVGGDMLGRAIDKASLTTNVALDNALRETTQKGAPLSNIKGALSAGQKPQRDLSTIWLMSRVATKAKQPMLKKQLAAGGYMAMEIPQKVYDSEGENAGVRVSGDEVVADFDTENRRLLAEEKCREVSQGANENVQKNLSEARTAMSGLRNVPKECGGDISSWSNNLRTVKTKCQEVNSVFDNMKTFCGAKVTGGSCQTIRLDDFESQYNNICQGYELLTDEEKLVRDEQLAALTADIDYEVKDSFNVSIDGREQPGSNPFFPTSSM